MSEEYKMTLLDVKKYFVTSYRFAKQTGMSPNNWENWERRGHIPYDSQRRIEQRTLGKLVANSADLPAL
jgi:hypothetical protein